MEYLDATMKIFNYIMEAAGVAGIFVALYCWLRKPSTENKATLDRHEDDIKELKVHVESDYNDIKEIKKMQSAMCKALVHIMDHQIYGNHTDDMKQAKSDLLDLISPS